jgi:hypothetical protein
MTALTLRDVEVADSLALARLDDDGAPAAVTSVISHGSTKTTGNPPHSQRHHRRQLGTDHVASGSPSTPAGAAWAAMNTASPQPRHHPARGRTGLVYGVLHGLVLSVWRGDES